MKKTIVLDCDDTIADLKSLMMESLNKLTGKSLKENDLYKFGINDIYGITDQGFYDCMINNHILENIKPFSETKGLLTDLLKSEYDVIIITSRAYHPNALKVTREWFAKYEIPYSKLIISEHGKKKSDYVEKEDNVVLFIDDRIENCEDFISSGKSKMVKLFDQPWNQYSSIDRITNLSEVRQLLDM